jgi:hypothetical protein
LLDQKVTKTQVSRKASLSHRAFSLQISQNHELQNVALLRSRRANASTTITMLFLRSRLPLFWLISPEAVLLTGKISSLLLL